MFYENICDLLNEVGEFIKIDDIEKQINLLPFTLYEGIKNSILRSWPDITYEYNSWPSLANISVHSQFWLGIKRVPDLLINADL